MGLRWGFKSEANEIAREVRAELRLAPYDRLDPWQLASHLAIDVVPLSDYRQDAAAAIRHFATIDRSAFSAVTVFSGSARVIVHNDFHAVSRQSSNVTHELSHGLLLHPPAPALDALGCRDWDQDLEDEANWLAGALLLPEEAALLVARLELSDAEIAERFRISTPMARFRMNVTAARRRVQRGQRRPLQRARARQ